MASPTYHHVSDGDVQKQQQMQRTNNGGAKKSAMSKKAHVMHVDCTASDGESDDEAEEGDSSANEVSDGDDSEPDAIALSDARSLEKQGKRLAGLEAGDTCTDDTTQAVAGATADNEDDDDDYAGVEDVSDDDEDTGDVNDRSVMRAVEQDLREEFEMTEQRRNTDHLSTDMDTMFLQEDDALARSLNLQAGGNRQAVSDFNVNLDDDPFVGLPFEDSLYREMYNDAEKALGMFPENEVQRERQPSEDSTLTKKRVRFCDPVIEVYKTLSRTSSMGSDDDDPNDLYPDLFDTPDADHSALKQTIMDVDAQFMAEYSDAGSCYDFDGDEERMAFAIDEEESDSDDSSSFGETDEEGDTTDEETEEESIARMQAMQKRADSARKNSPSTPTPTPRTASPLATGSPSTPRTGKGPRLGKFVIDKTKATFSSDASGKGIKILPPQNPTAKDKAFWDRVKSVNDARAGASRSTAYYRMRYSATENMPQRPFTAQCTLGSMFNGNLDILRNNDASGLAGDLFPGLIPRSGSFTGTMTEDSEQELEDVNMHEFIDLDADDESDIEEPASASSSQMFSPDASPRGSFSSSSQARRNDSLLEHLDQQRGLVGSFRRNQSFARHITSLPSNPSRRAAVQESNALQKGRRAAANINMTPARKKRVSQDLNLTGAGVRKAVGSPLAGRRPRSRGGSLSGGMNQTLGPALM